MFLNASKRFLSLLLALVMVLSLCPVMQAEASTEGTLSDTTNIEVTDEGEATWELSGSGITASVTGSGGMCSSSKSGTLTIKNISEYPIQLSFGWSFNANGGSVDVGGSTSETGNFTQELAQNSKVSIKITSASGNKTSVLTITNLKVHGTVTFDAKQK